MSPYARAAVGTAALALLGAAGPAGAIVHKRPPAPVAAAKPSAASTTLAASACPPGTLPDGGGCVPFRSVDSDDAGKEREARSNVHRDRHGQTKVYDQIPRDPERPAAYEAYRFPIPVPEGEKLLLSGYDLDRPDEAQRRGAHLSAVGHGGVDLVAKRGTPVRSLPLEHQDGDAEILYAGPLFGTTVVTRHTVREGGRLRDYVVLHGHLDAIAPGATRGATVREGDPLGFVGDTGSEGIVHLHLEARRVRDGVDPRSLQPGQIADNARTVAIDPRNVLPLR